jgi:hypothetical protein
MPDTPTPTSAPTSLPPCWTSGWRTLYPAREEGGVDRHRSERAARARARRLSALPGHVVGWYASPSGEVRIA